MMDFIKTRMGQVFFNGQIPQAIRALERLAAAMERAYPEEPKAEACEMRRDAFRQMLVAKFVPHFGHFNPPASLPEIMKAASIRAFVEGDAGVEAETLRFYLKQLDEKGELIFKGEP